MSFDLTSFLPYQLSSAAEAVSRAFAERYRAQYGLSIPEWRVIAHLHQAERVSVRDIHLMVGMDKPKVSRAAARLQGMGYVHKAKNADDKRLVELTLTEAGRRIMSELIPIAEEFEAELVDHLGSEANALRQSLTRLNDVASRGR